MNNEKTEFDTMMGKMFFLQFSGRHDFEKFENFLEKFCFSPINYLDINCIQCKEKCLNIEKLLHYKEELKGTHVVLVNYEKWFFAFSPDQESLIREIIFYFKEEWAINFSLSENFAFSKEWWKSRGAS